MSQLIRHLNKTYGNKEQDSVHEIICDTIVTKELSQESKVLLEKYQHAKSLSFISCQLKSLKNLPNIPSIEEVQFSDNHISGNELSYLLIYPKLTKIKLCNNLIKEIKDLKCFQELKDLSSLDLSECPVTLLPQYREKMFEMLPQLKYLDLVSKTGENCSELDDQEDEEEEEEENEKDNESFVVEDEEEEGEDEEEEEEEAPENKEDEYTPGKKRKVD